MISNGYIYYVAAVAITSFILPFVNAQTSPTTVNKLPLFDPSTPLYSALWYGIRSACPDLNEKCIEIYVSGYISETLGISEDYPNSTAQETESPSTTEPDHEEACWPIVGDGPIRGPLVLVLLRAEMRQMLVELRQCKISLHRKRNQTPPEVKVRLVWL
jgi:hypothetical protein